jgi:hypothetical protein
MTRRFERGTDMSAQATYNDKAPLLGFLVEQSDLEIKVRVSGGEWVIRRDDVESMSDWDSAIAVDFEGRPVQVVAKSGATLGFMQSVTVMASERPMTLPEGLSRLVGDQRMRELSDAWGAQFDLQVVDPDVGQSPTVCDCSDPNGFGLVIKTDDCRD